MFWTTPVDLSISFFNSNSLFSCILKLCCLVLYFLGGLILYHYGMVLFFPSDFLCSDVYCLVLLLSLFFINVGLIFFFIFLLSTYLHWYIWSEFLYTVYNWIILLNPVCQSLSISLFSPFTFKVTIDIIGLKYAILLLIFCLLWSCSCFSLVLLWINGTFF